MTDKLRAAVTKLSLLKSSAPKTPDIPEDIGATWVVSLTTPAGKVVSQTFNYDGASYLGDVLQDLGDQVGMKGVEIARATFDYFLDPENHDSLREFTTPATLVLTPDRIVIDGSLMRCREFVTKYGTLKKARNNSSWVEPVGYQLVVVKVSPWESPAYRGMVEARAKEFADAMEKYIKDLSEARTTVYGYIAESMRTHT